MSNAKVFVIGCQPERRQSFEPASRYGQVVEVLTGPHNPFEVDILSAKLHTALFVEGQMKAGDFLILCGQGVLNAITIALVQAAFGEVNVLVYGAKRHDYTARTIRPLGLLAKERK